MSVRRPRRAGELIFALALLAFSLAAFWQAYGISGFSGLSTAGVFPMLASGAMVLSALCILWHTLAAPRARAEAGQTPRPEVLRFFAEVLPWRHVLTVALILAYLLAIPWLGFLVGSGLFLFVAFAYLWRPGGKRGLLVSLLLSAFCLGAIYLVFRIVFQVVLPQGSLWRDTLFRGFL
ncbi:MAG: hypothetical protein Tsb0032_42730 [Kiloniellaceae bacterium]